MITDALAGKKFRGSPSSGPRETLARDFTGKLTTQIFVLRLQVKCAHLRVRMAVSKSVRFEVFARDGFCCQYCGRRPPDVVLEADHIHPRAKGGGDEKINLITSCYDCNRGKRAKVISQVAPRPDADLEFLKTQQEIAEVQRFLESKKKRDELNEQLCDALREAWYATLTENDGPANKVLLPWIMRQRKLIRSGGR